MRNLVPSMEYSFLFNFYSRSLYICLKGYNFAHQWYGNQNFALSGKEKERYFCENMLTVAMSYFTLSKTFVFSKFKMKNVVIFQLTASSYKLEGFIHPSVLHFPVLYLWIYPAKLNRTSLRCWMSRVKKKKERETKELQKIFSV